MSSQSPDVVLSWPSRFGLPMTPNRGDMSAWLAYDFTDKEEEHAVMTGAGGWMGSLVMRCLMSRCCQHHRVPAPQHAVEANLDN